MYIVRPCLEKKKKKEEAGGGELSQVETVERIFHVSF